MASIIRIKAIAEMIKKVYLMIVLATSNSVCHSQGNLSDIQVCHTSEKGLNCVGVADYILSLKNGTFSGFRTLNNSIRFEESIKKFELKNSHPIGTKDSLIVLQLTTDGPILKNRDTLVYLSRFNSNPPNQGGTFVDLFNFHFFCGI